MITDPRIPTVEEHWEAWLDRSCRCGFPHPKPGHVGPPPQHVYIEGVGDVTYPAYPAVMGGYEPVPPSPTEDG